MKRFIAAAALAVAQWQPIHAQTILGSIPAEFQGDWCWQENTVWAWIGCHCATANAAAAMNLFIGVFLLNTNGFVKSAVTGQKPHANARRLDLDVTVVQLTAV